MMYDNKKFTPIKGYTEYYICKDTSEVLSTKERKGTLPNTYNILKQTVNSSKPTNNYYVVMLVDPLGNKSKKSIHRLLMETFVPNTENKAHVNHIDGNKHNNNMSNLEWATPKENSQHAVDTGLTTHTHCEKPVHQYNLKGFYIDSFKSDAEADRVTGIAKQNISKVCLGKRPNAGGYLWSRDKTTSIPAYTGKPIPKELVVLNLNTLITTKHSWSIPAMCRDLGLNSANVSYSIRKHGYYLDVNFKVTRTYFD